MEDLKAGRELDAQIARLLGWTEVTSRRTADGTWTGIRHDWSVPVIDDVPHYRTNIAFAWLVVEDMNARGYWCEMRTPFGTGDLNDGYWCGFTPHGTSGWNGTPDHWTDAPTLTEAICLAALAARAGEGEG